MTSFVIILAEFEISLFIFIFLISRRIGKRKMMIGASLIFLLTAGIVPIAVNTKTSTTNTTQPDTTTTQPDIDLQCFSCNVSV